MARAGGHWRQEQRPHDEYRNVGPGEWSELEEHFDKRKVELGSRPYGTPCQHEHACVRCPMLHIDPHMLPRLREIEDGLVARRRRAVHEGWLGEIDGIELTLQLLREKQAGAETHIGCGRVGDAWTAVQLTPVHESGH